ncbi:MAG: lytic transglycosylase domain-containing protein [Acetobacteraceae bacterium]
MRVSVSILLAGLASLLAAQAAPPARAQDVGSATIAAIRTDRWTDAQAAASRFADPVPQKIVLYYRLRAPGAATATEVADFMRLNPDWPAQNILQRRRDEAIALEPDDAIVLAQCTPNKSLPAPLPPVSQGRALLRCAEALANAGRTGEANQTARRAWVEAIDDAGTETLFLNRWAGVPSSEDQWARFQRLAWTDTAGATRQAARLANTQRSAAEARLAVRRDDPAAESLVAALPASFRDDPGLMLDRAKAARRTDRIADALALWQSGGAQAQRAAPDHAAAFWTERNLIARRLIKDGNAAGAYSVTAGNSPAAGETLVDGQFLAGFIALRLLKDPVKATTHFQALAEASPAVITQGRAHYWLARAAAASGADPKPEYTKAAAWVTTYYGQLAALALGDSTAGLAARIRDVRDPGWTADTAQAFAGHEVMRAAAWLIAWGDTTRARQFLLRMDEIAPITQERMLTAAFAAQVGMIEPSVWITRRMGRDGVMVPNLGWPRPYNPPAPPDPAFSLGIMRQESNFDIAAVSSSGARGLMQLMPPTASYVAKRLGVPVSIPSLTVDANANMRLGTAYLQEVLDKFDGYLPLAAAAYNAGPHRVSQWLTENGDPRTGPVDMVDWVELIPISETRNYVQRVVENTAIYRAQQQDNTPVLQGSWTR